MPRFELLLPNLLTGREKAPHESCELEGFIWGQGGLAYEGASLR